MSLNHSTIFVSYRDGSKPNGKKVVMGFSGLMGWMSTPVYTDRDGQIEINQNTDVFSKIYGR